MTKDSACSSAIGLDKKRVCFDKKKFIMEIEDKKLTTSNEEWDE